MRQRQSRTLRPVVKSPVGKGWCGWQTKPFQNMVEAHMTWATRAPLTGQKEEAMVFVLSSDSQPLDPCHPARARKLLKKGRAVVYRTYPFTIRLADRTCAESVVHDHRLKIDPGSKTTGLAIVQEGTERVVWAGELTHRGQQIRDAMLARRAVRRSRRQRHTRYRKPRYLNRRRKDGWLPPSLQHRVETTLSWVKRLMRFCPLRALSLELVKFDTQLMQNAEISGIEYQQGTLAGYELREYMLEKWGRTCAYCRAENVPLQLEHLIPKGRGGSNRVSNLTLSCEDCNKKKGDLTASEFGYPHLMEQAKQPLKDAAAINATHWAVWRRLSDLDLPVEAGTGGRTKWNRSRLGWEKVHWRDAACVGASTPDQLRSAVANVLLIAAKGHGSRQMCGTDTHGFPIRHRRKQKRYFGFKTGDLVRAVVGAGKRLGTHIGRVLVRASGSFDIATARGRQAGIGYRYYRIIQRADGYTYGLKPLKLGRSSQGSSAWASRPEG
jgi:5-methylcytosine-specific restriction endonuclease McrA